MKAGMRAWSIVAVLPVAGTMMACSGAGSAPEAEPVAATADGLLHCGFREGVDSEGNSYPDEIIFARDKLSAALLAGGFEAELGFSKVESCEQATKVAERLNRVALAGEDDFPSLQYPWEIEPQDKLKNGALNTSASGNIPGTLEVVVGGDTCTGTLIGFGTALTAAHCVDTVLNPALTNLDTSAQVPVRVSLWRPSDNSWHCISRTVATNAKCNANETRTAKVIMLGPYTGSDNWDSDIAIIMLTDGNQAAPNPSWPGVTTSDFLRVYADSFNNFSSYNTSGRGATNNDGSGSGTMKWGGFGNDSFGNYQYQSETRNPRICRGDSGGPSTILNSGFNMAIGHIVGADLSGNCASDAGLQYGTRFHTGGNGSKINWVAGWMSAERGEGCSDFTGTVGAYKRCF